MRRPWFPFYISDFRIDTLELGTDEIGVYFMMLCLAWSRGGPLPGDDESLKRMLKSCFRSFHGLTYNRIVPKILTKYFYRDADGNWRQKRVEKELRIAEEFSEKQSRNAQERWKKNARMDSDSVENQLLNGCGGNATAYAYHNHNHKKEKEEEKERGSLASALPGGALARPKPNGWGGRDLSHLPTAPPKRAGQDRLRLSTGALLIDGKAYREE